MSSCLAGSDYETETETKARAAAEELSSSRNISCLLILRGLQFNISERKMILNTAMKMKNETDFGKSSWMYERLA